MELVNTSGFLVQTCIPNAFASPPLQVHLCKSTEWYVSTNVPCRFLCEDLCYRDMLRLGIISVVLSVILLVWCRIMCFSATCTRLCVCNVSCQVMYVDLLMCIPYVVYMCYFVICLFELHTMIIGILCICNIIIFAIYLSFLSLRHEKKYFCWWYKSI